MEEFKPPADAIEIVINNFAPPSDAIEVSQEDDEKKKKAVTENTANVAAEDQSSTDLASENGSSDSRKLTNDEQLDLAFGNGKKPYKPINLYEQIDLVNEEFDEETKDFRKYIGNELVKDKEKRNNEILNSGFKLKEDGKYTNEDLIKLRDLGVEVPEELITIPLKDPKTIGGKKFETALRPENISIIEDLFKNENGKSPVAQEVFEVLQKNKTQESNDLKILTARKNADKDSDINEYTTNRLSSLADLQAKSFAGEENFNKLKSSSTKEERQKVLNDIFDTESAIELIDDDGNFIEPSKLNRQELQRQKNELNEAIEEYSYMAPNQLYKAYNDIENELVSLGAQLYDKGEEGILEETNLAQRANEFLINLGMDPAEGDKGLREDMKDLQRMKNTGEASSNLSFIPKSDNILVKKYNKKLKEFQTIQTAIGLNVDLTSIDRASTLDILGIETERALGFDNSSINQMQNIMVNNILDDKLNLKATEQELELFGEPGEEYVKQPDQLLNTERLVSSLPGLTKMGIEMAATYYLLGGSANVGKITSGIGEAVAVNVAKRGININTANVIGRYSSGVIQESIGLTGSNVIGSNVFGSEKMPVIPFALGSQLGHLGGDWIGKTMLPSIRNMAVKNKYLGGVVNFLDTKGSSTINGALKFAAKPAIGATSIKFGEGVSGVVDVVKDEKDFSELWHEITDVDSFFETYGALLFMAGARPDTYTNRVVENFHRDIDRFRGNSPEWNSMARQLGLATKKNAKWSDSEINEALNKRKIEIIENKDITATQANEMINNAKYLAGRLKLKKALDQVNTNVKAETWNTKYKNLQLTIKSLEAGNGVTPQDIINMTEAGLANQGASVVLELQKLGINEADAVQIYKSSNSSYNQASKYFKDPNSKNFKRYLESTSKEQTNENIKENLKTQLNNKEINKVTYDLELERLDADILLEQTKQKTLIDIARGDTQQRIKETLDYTEEVKAEGTEVRELSSEEFNKLKSELTGKQPETIGYGFQTTIDGKTVFVINKDAMAPQGGKYKFESGGKEYVVEGFKGSTQKHELFHPVFERRFDQSAVDSRVRQKAKTSRDLESARKEVEKEDLDYIDSFKNRLKELGVFNRVEQEMMQRPGYKDLIEGNKRDVQIEKEFINEFLELQGEGQLNSLLEGANIKKVGTEVIELKNGADVADFFITGVEKTPEGKAEVKKALEEYKELLKDGSTSIQTSEKDLKSLAKEYKENPSNIELEKVEDLIQQYTASGIAALARIANRGTRKVPVNTKDPNVTSGIADLLILEFDSFIKNYNPSKGEPSTYMNLIAERILPKYIEKFKPKETTRIEDLTREIADTKTPETELTDKEAATKETERLVSVFEGKEAKAKEKEIIEVFKDLRTDAKKLQQARLKGFGGTPKEELSKVAELLFNIPEGTKVSNPSKNVLPTINIVDSKGKKISNKRLDAGEKGIIEAKDFLSLRDYFKDKNNLKRFLNVSLPEYNVNTPQAIVNTKGEIIEVSPDVVGRGIRLPDRIYDYFYEQFIDPTGVMTSPSGRGKGKTSQVPKVYKIKPEFRKPSNEVIEKVYKEILADLKLSELPEAYTRDIAQLVKGMALVETMAVANQAKRAKLPAETAAEKQLIADIKSSSSKLAMSEKLLPNKTQVSKMTDLMGAYNFFDPNSVIKARKVITEDYAKIFGPGLLTRMFRDLIPGGGRAEKVLGKQMAIGSFEAIGSTKKSKEKIIEDLTKQYIKQGLTKTKAKAEAKKEANEVERLEQQYLSNNQTLLENDLILDIDNLKRNIEQQGLKDNAAAEIMLEAFGKGQKLNKLASNLANLKTRKQATELLIEKFKEAYDANPEASEVLREFIYNNKASGMLGKDVALMRGKHVDAAERNKYEEHTYPFSSWAIRTMDAITNKNPKVLEGWKKWAAENYYQIAFDLKNVIEVSDGKFLNYQGAVDQRFKRVDGEGIYDSQSGEHPILEKALNEAFKTGDFSKVPASEIRFFNEYVKLNPNTLYLDGVTYAKKYNVEVDSYLQKNPNIVEVQADLIFKQLTDPNFTSKKAKEYLDNVIKVIGTKQADKAFKQTKSNVDQSGVMNTSEKMTTNQLVEKSKVLDKALANARKVKKEPKKIRVFDFDDTVGTSKNKVFATKGNERKVLNAEEFAKEGLELIDKGWEMDFSDFNKVTEGGKGPLFDLMKTMKEAKGERDMFILTARAPEAAPAIHVFLKEMGIDIPLENIIGLGNSTGKAKADWLVGKAAEGYNDFYFADDAPQNVKAVRDALEVLDIKSQVQQARMNASERLSEDFNEILEQRTGIGREKVFSDIKAEIRGNKAKKVKFFIPPSAEDFLGLLYSTLPKGEKGTKALNFYQKNLFDPYTRATDNLSTDRVNLMADFKELKKELDVPKDLRKQTKSGFTNEQAVRVYLWAKTGMEIPGLSKSDFKELNDIVEADSKLKVFAEQILSITKGDGYSAPGQHWQAGTITTDLIDILNTTKRAKYLESWKENVDIIFSKENMNKLEAAFGPKYREAMENILTRMKSGSNRTAGGNRLSNQVLDYINQSTGVTMFFNTRSALLQTISSANFINWSFNNPLRAGQAFANQPQYWKDFVELMNSDYLKDRRNGLKLNISESEIADAAKTSKNKAKAAINYIIEKGYMPTRFADSFAIASGGAMFYRNRIKDLVKKGMTEAEAKEIAMKEFRQASEKSQQSSDPSKISMQQSGDLGRIILQYVNTPMQYARIQKRDIQDMVNRRPIQGKTLAQSNRIRLSRIAYYSFLQNLMFNALQQGAFALGFGDDDEELTEEQMESKAKFKQDKLFNTVNGMLDSQLRGLGLGGVTIQVLKNLGIDIYKRSKKDRPEYADSYYKLLEFSPSIKSKLSKFKSAAYPFDTKKRRQEVFDKGFSLDNPAYESMAKVITATTNVPLDRMYTKIENLKHAMADETEAWQAVANVLGWPTWQLEQREYTNSVELTPMQKELQKQTKEYEKYKEAEGSTDYEVIKKLNSSQQIKMLKDLGYDNYTIKKAKSEKDKIDLIIKVNSGEEIKVNKEEKELAKYKALSKAEQVRKLDSLGLSKAAIRKLKYEADRVKKLLKLMNK